jgi:DNA-binding CsgD family transcriptional regulator/tetratricopeptide (TPR) repeat protein
VSLVERDVELARVREAVAAAHNDGGGVVIAVSGEPGAGKSALLAAALADVPAYWGWCEPGLTPRPLGPFRDALRSGALGGAEVPDDPSEALLAAMTQAPLLLAIEDAHWIDDASARVLRFLGRRMTGTRGVVVLSYRDSIAPDHPLRQVLADLATSPVLLRVELDGLTPAGVAELLVDSDRDAEEVHRVTGGNAFLVSALRDAPGEDLSSSVRDLAWSWARRLEPGALDLLKTVSVVPGRLLLEELRDRGADLDGLVLAGLLQPGERSLQFRHELVRRAIDADLSPDERLRAHAAAYARLGRRADAEPSELAFHALHAGLTDEALTHEQRAAESAVSSGAHTQAVEHYRRLVELGDRRLRPEELALACVALAREEWAIGHDADARRYAAQAAALVKDDDPRLGGLTLLARSRAAQSEAERVVFAERAVELLEEVGDGPDLAAACAHVATRRMVARDLDVAAGWARRALAMIEEDEQPETAVLALQALGCSLTLAGKDDGCTFLRHALDVGIRAGVDEDLGLAYANYVSAAGEARLYAKVAEIQDEALRFFGDHDLDGTGRYARAWIGRCAFDQGRWQEATRWSDEVLSDQDSISEISAIVALTVRGRIAVRRGESGGEVALAQALALARELGALQRLAPVSVALAEAAWLGGADAGTAGTADLEAAFALTEDREVPAFRAELAWWLRRLGHDIPDVPNAPSPWNDWLSGQHEQAGEVWLRMGCPYEAADAFGECDDEEVLRRALELIDGLGAAPLRARVVRRMRELGVKSIPRGPRKETAGDEQGLTAREQEVLVWLREGSTDAQIAAALHLSVKTVGHHVSAILRKTESGSRRDLRR